MLPLEHSAILLIPEWPFYTGSTVDQLIIGASFTLLKFQYLNQENHQSNDLQLLIPTPVSERKKANVSPCILWYFCRLSVATGILAVTALTRLGFMFILPT